MEVPVVEATLHEDLRKFLLDDLPATRVAALQERGFVRHRDYPEVPGHNYVEGYFHALRGRPRDRVLSVHPRWPASQTLYRQPAPLRIAAFCTALRRRNTTGLASLVSALGDEAVVLGGALARGALFADVSVQLHWGDAVPAQHADWHRDRVCSLLHVALGLQGFRQLLARRQVGGPASREEVLPQAQGAAYLSAPCYFRHAVEFPTEESVVSMQCRLLLEPEEFRKLDKLQNSDTSRRAVITYLESKALVLPTLQEVMEVAAELERHFPAAGQKPASWVPRKALVLEGLDRSEGRLHAAALRGYTEVARALLVHLSFPGVNARDAHGRTALHLAAGRGHLEIVEAFLDSSRFTEVGAKDEEGKTALQLAVEGGHLDVTNLLDHPRVGVSARAQYDPFAAHSELLRNSQV